MCSSDLSSTLGLSFELKRIGPLAAFVAALVYLLALFLPAVSNTTENLSASFYSEFLIKTICQHLLLLVGLDTLIYRKYCDTPPILVGHQCRRRRRPRPPSVIPREAFAWLSLPSSHATAPHLPSARCGQRGHGRRMRGRSRTWPAPFHGIKGYHPRPWHARVLARDHPTARPLRDPPARGA